MNILEAIAHPAIFAPWFKKPESYAAWFAFLAALFGLTMTDEQAAIYRKHTGRTDLPTDVSKEGWLVIGRRGGKSFMMALIAVYLACFKSYKPYLAPGERATVMVIAADRKQARVVLRYIKALLTGIPSLAKLIQRQTADSFDLTNSVTIEVGTASAKTTRGYSFAAILADEIAFWPIGDEAAQPDYEILAALRPGMTTIPTAMLICASSPYARRGALWDAFSRWHGKDGAPLVWRAATRDMNPSIPQAWIDAEMEKDPASASAEYGAQFRSDLEAFVNIDVVMGCVSTGRTIRPYVPGIKYAAFVDPAGGSGKDAMTLAIAHQQDDMVVIDYIAERKPPFSPEEVVDEFCDILQEYEISLVSGDRWGGEFVRQPFRKRHVDYVLRTPPRSELYQEFLPLLNSGLVDLLDNPKLVGQLVSLERRTGRGRDAIDHPPGAHDDVANAVAGVAWVVTLKPTVPMGFGVQSGNADCYPAWMYPQPKHQHATFSGTDHINGVDQNARRKVDPFKQAVLKLQGNKP